MTGQMRLRKQAQSGDPARARKLVPLGICHRMQGQPGDQVIENSAELRQVLEALDFAAERFNDPFTTFTAGKIGHGRTVYQAAGCGDPHSAQNFAARRILLPQLKQNFISPEGAAAGGAACGGAA